MSEDGKIASSAIGGEEVDSWLHSWEDMGRWAEQPAKRRRGGRAAFQMGSSCWLNSWPIAGSSWRNAFAVCFLFEEKDSRGGAPPNQSGETDAILRGVRATPVGHNRRGRGRKETSKKRIHTFTRDLMECQNIANHRT